MEEKIKYLELVEGSFTQEHEQKAQEWPYVAYSESEGVVYTVIPQPIPET
jgi:hypothetical protein